MVFENTPIRVESLPDIRDEELQRLHPDWLKVELGGNLLFFALLLVGWLVGSAVWGWPDWLSNLLFALWVVFLVAGWILIRKNYQVSGYLLREHDITFRRGVLWRSDTTLPFNRLQHCEITQGPIEKWFGLATLKLYTAGGSSSDLAIPGLPMEDARRIRAFVSGKIQTDEPYE